MHDRVIVADLIRGFVLLAIVAATTTLGVKGVIDAAAATGILGAVGGAVGAIGAAAVGGRAALQKGSEENHG